MSVSLVFRKDLEDVLRSRMLWALLALFTLLIGIVAAGSAGSVGDDPANVYPLFVNIGAAIAIPIAAIFVGYLAITGERESGSLRVLFGLSHGRRDILLGKLLSRIAAILVVTAVVVVLAAAVTVGVFGEFPVVSFAWFVLLTTLLAIALTSFAVSVSAMASTRYRAMAGAVGGYLAAIMFWYPAVAGLHYVVEGGRPGATVPEWYLAAQLLNPLEAYRQAIMLVADQNAFLLVGWEMIIEDIDQTLVQEPGALSAANRIAGDLPVYLSEWAAVAVLVAWIVLPVLVAYWSFSRADLN